MDLQFKELTIESQEELKPYWNLREIVSCEYNFNTLFMWAKHNQIEYATTPNFAVFSEIYQDKHITLMPLCKEVHFKEAFESIKEYFDKIGKPLAIFVTDKTFMEFVQNEYPDQYEIRAERDLSDYIYDADKLRTLSGKKYNKKRNHLNAFYQTYQDRFHYRSLRKEDREVVCTFLRRWRLQKDLITEDLQDELLAICNIFKNLNNLDIRCGGIYIDNNLEAFSIGSKIAGGKGVDIHVEKANDSIRGLYQLINQQFLVNEFPDVEWVNREEDLGIEGLRKAKLSYYPIQILEKYSILQK